MADYVNHELYSDFDVMFKRNAKTGDVIKKINEDDIRQSLRLLLQTRFYDRKWNPKLGSYLPEMLFDQDDDYIKRIVEDQITTLLTNYEPRITLESVKVYNATEEDAAIGKVTILINYKINIVNTHDTYVYTVSRLN